MNPVAETPAYQLVASVIGTRQAAALNHYNAAFNNDHYRAAINTEYARSYNEKAAIEHPDAAAHFQNLLLDQALALCGYPYIAIYGDLFNLLPEEAYIFLQDFIYQGEPTQEPNAPIVNEIVFLMTGEDINPQPPTPAPDAHLEAAYEERFETGE
jgi:hypothetical protein